MTPHLLLIQETTLRNLGVTQDQRAAMSQQAHKPKPIPSDFPDGVFPKFYEPMAYRLEGDPM
jgi:hypothetical protein